MSTYNITQELVNVSSFGDTCVLNQYALLDTVGKLPKVAFMFAVATLVFLFIHIAIIPMFHKHKYFSQFSDSFLILAFMTSVWVPLILMYFVFSLDAEGWHVVENWIIGLALGGCVVVAWFWRERVKEVFERLRGLD